MTQVIFGIIFIVLISNGLIPFYAELGIIILVLLNVGAPDESEKNTK